MGVVEDLAAALGYEAEYIGWEAIALPNGEKHVIPLNDLKPHTEMAKCWCHPTDDDGVLVHHAMDNRELWESDRKAS